MTFRTETVQCTVFPIQKYSREGTTSQQAQVLGTRDKAPQTNHKSMGWEHLSLQPLTCRVALHYRDPDTSITMLSVEWIPPNAVSIVLVRTPDAAYSQESLCLQGVCSSHENSSVQITYHGTRIGVRYTGEPDARACRPLRRFQLQLHDAHDTRALVSLIEHKCTCVPAQIDASISKTLTPPSTPVPVERGVHSTILTPPLRQSARSARAIRGHTFDD